MSQANSTAAPTTTLPGRGIRVLDSLRSHPRLAILTCLAVVLAGLPVVMLKGGPKYSTVATLQVAPRYMKNLRDDNELDFQSNSQYRQFVEQQTKTINRYDVLERALRSLETPASQTEEISTARLPSEGLRLARALPEPLFASVSAPAATSPHSLWRRDGEPERRAIERLQRELVIRPVPDTYLIQISLEATRRDGLERVVNAVAESFLAVAKEEQVYGASERVRQLQQREKELVEGIDAMTRQRSEIARELGVTAFKAEDGNPFDKLVQKLREDLAEARNRRFDAEARQTAFRNQRETDLTTRSVLENVLLDPGLNSLKSSLNKRRADLVTLMAGLKDNHPGHIAAREEIADIDREILRETERLTARLFEGTGKRYDTGVEQARRLETDLQQALNEMSGRSDAYAARFNEAVTLTNDMEQLRKELDSVRERLNFFAIENSSPGFVRPVTAALPPDLPGGTSRKKLLLMVLLAALGAGVAAPILADLRDRRVRTVNDAHRCLGFAPIGWLVERVDADSQRYAEDQLRRLASALIREQDNQGTRAITFSAVKPGAGTTTLVLELAHALNRLGISTLALEANAFRPDARFPAGPGLATLLAAPQGEPAIEVRDGVPLLGVGLPAGSTLDGLDHLSGVLATLGERYRFVLIDAPPLLTASDSELIIRASRAAITVVEAGAVSAGEVQRAARQLDVLAPASLGAVVNRIEPFHGGGYVRSLIAEHLSREKQAGHSLRSDLRDTVNALRWDATALLLRVAAPLLRLRPVPTSRQGKDSGHDTY